MRRLLAALLLVCLLAGTAAAAVQRSKQKTTVNGSIVTCEVYNIDGSNYYKLRDLAFLLTGTKSQFSVGWDAESGTVRIEEAKPYDAVGGELDMGEDRSATAQPSAQKLLINGFTADGLSAYNIGGNNYFRLRDLGEWLNFYVEYNELADTVAITSDSSGSCGCELVDEE